MYPVTHAARHAFVLERRGAREQHDPWRFQSLLVEDERSADGSLTRVATVFLTGRECSWRCVMCDLWRNTTTTDTPPGAIPAQITAARRRLGHQSARITRIKLYNASNFFDPRAVPEEDYEAIAHELADLEGVIVESHPALVGRGVDRFLSALRTNQRSPVAPVQLEVAMGLETAHPVALERLNKHISIGDFAAAAGRLRDRGVDVRVFLLIAPPFIAPAEQDRWLLQSIDTAFSCGATVVSLIPTRTGNGAMESLEAGGYFVTPRLDDIERSAELAVSRPLPGRVFVDLWDLQRFARCSHCLDRRRQRLHAMNLEQRYVAAVSCTSCGHGLTA